MHFTHDIKYENCHGKSVYGHGMSFDGHGKSLDGKELRDGGRLFSRT
jgi:hypothetical protein